MLPLSTIVIKVDRHLRHAAVLSFCLQLGSFSPVWAAEPALAPPPGSSGVAKLLAERLPRDHVTHKPFDDVIAGKAWDAFLSSFDRDHAYFLEPDISLFRARRNTIDDELKDGKVSFAYEVFTVWRERVGNRCAYVQELVKKGFDLSLNETCERDRKNAPWPRNEAEWNEVWRKRIKNEYVQRVVKSRLAMAKGDKTAAEEASAVETIAKGYRDYRAMVEKTESGRVLETYLSAFCRAYDPHCEYMSPAAAEEFTSEMKLSFAGIGATLGVEDGVVKIEGLIPGGPAARDKRDIALKPGDRIIAVAEGNAAAVDVRHMPLYKVARLIRGKKGTKVVLTAVPAGEAGDAASRQVDLVRDEVKMEDHAAKCQTIAVTNSAGAVRKLAFVELPAFYSDIEGLREKKSGFKSSSCDVGRLLLKAREDGVDGMVLDLRNNGGGALAEALQTTGLFIRDGPVVQVGEGRRGGVLVDEDRAVAYSGPMVLLVNRLSASASEIVAGALQDYGRAVIAGDSRTHGKGTVQTVIPLGKDGKMGSLKVTTALFYRPTGNSTQLKGVTSDIVIPSPLEYAAGRGEDRLPNALEWSMIDEQAITPWGNLKPVVAELEERSLKRRAENPKFEAYTNLLVRIAAIQQPDTVSLNIDERLKLAREIRDLDERLKGADGKGDEAGPGGKAAWDPVKEETLNILSDMVEISGPAADVSDGSNQVFPSFLRRVDIPPDIERKVTALVEKLRDNDFRIRAQALDELKKIGPNAFPVLKDYAADADPEVRMAVKELLGGSK